MGQNIITNDGDYFYIHSGVSPIITGSVSLPAGGVMRGMSFDEANNMYYADGTTKYMYELDGISSTVTGSARATGLLSPIGLHYHNGSVLITDVIEYHVYAYSGLSSTLTGSIETLGYMSQGVTVDNNNNLIVTDKNSSNIFIYSGVTSTLTGSIDMGIGSDVASIDIDINNNLIISKIVPDDYIFICSGISNVFTGSFAAPNSYYRQLCSYYTTPTAQGVSLKALNGINKIIENGEPICLIYYDGTLATDDYDDEMSYTKSGTDIWTSGIHFPIKNKYGSEEAVLLEQGQILLTDKKLYLPGDVNVSGNMMIGVGSPIVSWFNMIPQGIQNYEINDISIYNKIFIRHSPTGSIL